jgi:hypothetical protein
MAMEVVVHYFGGSWESKGKNDSCRDYDFGDHGDSCLRRRNPKVRDTIPTQLRRKSSTGALAEGSRF